MAIGTIRRPKSHSKKESEWYWTAREGPFRGAVNVRNSFVIGTVLLRVTVRGRR